MGNEIENRVVDLQLYSDDFKRNCDEAITAINRLNKALEMKGSDQAFVKLEKAAASVSFEKLATSAEQVSSAMKDIAVHADSLTTVAANASEGSKEIANLQHSVEQVDLSPIERSVESINEKMSALGVVASTVLNSMTLMAVNTGKKVVRSLSGISAIQDGFREYETQINSVQTILANTQSKGSTIQDVTAALDELNVYADKTIYNFTEMTRNIGTFTAAGVGLEESTKAIQGIANLAAVSGSTSIQASTAMYQLSQALASGAVKLQDWNSVVNASMGGELFRNQLMKTARSMGIAVDEIIASAGTFRESLKDGWLTSDVLTQTLQKLTKSGAAEYLAELTGVSKDEIEAMQELVDKNEDGSVSYDKLAEKMAKTGKISKQDAIDILKMADTAEDAATKVKTVTQLMDTLKESIGSGWTKSFELVFGNFEEAKKTLTEASKAFSYIIDSISDARNNFLQEWKDLNGRDYAVDAILSAIKILKNFVDIAFKAFEQVHGLLKADSVVEFFYSFKVGMKSFALFEEGTSKLTGLGKSVKRIFKGIFAVLDIGSGIITTIWTILRPIVRVLGSFVGGVLYSALKVLGLLGNALAKLSKWLKDIGAISKITKPFTDFATAVKNLKNELKFEKVFKSFSNAMKNVKKSLHTLWDAIKVLIKPITDLRLKLNTKINVKPIDLVRKVFEKFSSIVKSISDGINKFATKLKKFAGITKEMDFLELISNKTSEFKTLFGTLTTQLDNMRTRINDIFSKLENSEAAKRLQELKNTFTNIKNELVNKLFPNGSTSDIGKNIIDGIITGIKNRVESLWSIAGDTANNILDTICDVLGIQSPSKEGMKIGDYLVQGIVKGIEKASSAIVQIIGALGKGLLDGFVRLFGDLIPRGATAIATLISSLTTSIAVITPQIGAFFASLTTSLIEGLAGVANALASNEGKVVKALTTIIDSIMSIVLKIFTAKLINSFSTGTKKISGSVSTLIDNLSKSINVTFNGINKGSKPAMNFAEKLRTVAEAVLMLAGAFKLLDSIDSDKLDSMAIMLGGLMTAMMSYSEVMNVVDKKFGTQSDTLYKTILSISGLMMALSYVIKAIDKVKDPEKVFEILVTCFGGLAGILFVISQFPPPDDKKLDSLTGFMGKLSAVLILIAISLRLVDSLKNAEQDLIALGSVLVVLTIVVSVLSALDSGKMDSIGKLIPKFALLGALLIMIAVALRIVDGGEHLLSATVALIAVLAAISVAVFLLGKFGSFDESLQEANKTMLTLSVVLLAIAASLWIIGQTRGALNAASALNRVLLMLVGAMVVLAVIGKFAPEVAMVTYVLLGLAALILSFAISINLLVRAIEYIGKLDPEMVWNGISSIAKAILVIGLSSVVGATGLAMLGAALIVLGAGLLATGVGLTSLISAIQLFIIVFTAMTSLIPTAIDNFIGMRDSLVELLTGLLTMGIEVLWNARTEIVNLVVDSLLEILTKLDDNSDAIFEKVKSLMDKLLTFLETNAKTWGRQGVNIAINFLKGMWQGFTDQFPNLTKFLTSLWDKIITGIKSFFGIHSPSTKFAEIAHNLIQGLINGVKDKIKAAKDAVVNVAKKCIEGLKTGLETAKTVGRQIVQGFINGIKGMFSTVFGWGQKLVSKFIGGAKDEGEIKSPSRAMKRIGAFMTEGFILGLQEYSTASALKMQIIDPLEMTAKSTKTFVKDVSDVLKVGGKSFKRSFAVLGNLLTADSKKLALNGKQLGNDLALSLGKHSLLDKNNTSKEAESYRKNLKKRSELNKKLGKLADKQTTITSAIDSDTKKLKKVKERIKKNTDEKAKVETKLSEANKKEQTLQEKLNALKQTKTYTTYETVTTSKEITTGSNSTTTKSGGVDNSAKIRSLQNENEKLDARINQTYDQAERERLREEKRSNLAKIQELQNAQTTSSNNTTTSNGKTQTVTSTETVAKTVTTTVGSAKEIQAAEDALKKAQNDSAKLKKKADAFNKKITNDTNKKNKLDNSIKDNNASLSSVKKSVEKTQQELDKVNLDIKNAEDKAAKIAKKTNSTYYGAAKYLSDAISIKAEKLYKKTDNYKSYKKALADEEKLQKQYKTEREKIFKKAGELDPKFASKTTKDYKKERSKYEKSNKDAEKAYKKSYNAQQAIIDRLNKKNKKASKSEKEANNKKIQVAKKAQAQAKKDYEATKKANDKEIARINKLIGYKKDLKTVNDKMTKSEKKVAEAEEKRIKDISSAWTEYVSTFEGVVKNMSAILAEGLGSQLDIFNQFEKDTSKSISQIIKEMQSQVTGTAEFYKNLEKLGTLGFNTDYIRELEAQGTSMAGVVETLTKATKEQINAINKSWTDKTLLESDIYLRNATQKVMDQDALVTMAANLLLNGMNKDIVTELFSSGDLTTLKAITAATLSDNKLIGQLNKVQTISTDITKTGPDLLASIIAMIDEGNLEDITAAKHQQISSVITNKSLSNIEKLAGNINDNFTAYMASQAVKSVNTTFMGTDKVENTNYFTQNFYSNVPLSAADIKRGNVQIMDFVMSTNP